MPSRGGSGGGDDWAAAGKDEAITFNETDLSLSTVNAAVSNGSVVRDSTTESISRPSDGNVYTDQTGLTENLEMSLNLEVVQITFTVSSNSARIGEILIDGETVATGSWGAGDTITVDKTLAPGDHLVESGEGSNSSYDLGFYMDGSTVSGSLLSISPSPTFGDYRNLSAVEVKSKIFEVTASWPLPEDLYAWDIALFQGDSAGGTQTIDVLDDSGNVLISDIKRGESLTGIDAGTNIQLRARVEAPTTENPSVDYLSRRFKR